jgi:hypothetical protein
MSQKIGKNGIYTLLADDLATRVEHELITEIKPSCQTRPVSLEIHTISQFSNVGFFIAEVALVQGFLFGLPCPFHSKKSSILIIQSFTTDATKH